MSPSGSRPSGLLESVADLVEGTVWSALPPSTVDAALRCTLHVLATTYLGSDLDIATRTTAYAMRNFPGTGTLVGHGRAVVPSEAAFANATMCHADFRDDAHSQSQSHPGVTVIPAALAAAEIVGGDLPAGTLGRAVVAGYQVIGRLGRVGALTSTQRGFRASSIYTVFGAAAAASVVLGLDRAQLVSALALAAQTAAGLNQPYLDGTDDWILLPGLAARGGLTAALLAREGVVGAPGILDGELGFLRAYADIVGPATVESPDLPAWEIEVTRLKSVLTCGWNQAPVNTLLRSGIDLADIDTINITLSREAHAFPGVANYGPYGSHTSAVLSLPFAIGALLGTGELETRSYRDVANPEISAAATRLSMGSRDDLHGYDSEIDVTLKDGSVVELRSPGGPPQWLLTRDEVFEGLKTKFRGAELDESKVDALASVIPGALSGASVRPLLDVLGGAA